MQLEFLTSVDSTMAYLQRLPDAATTDELYVVVAETQTAGRGQRGTHWESESGKN
ncbi:MAG: biotin--[acetyl-CoA-carboxylase] ligase, partial [Alloprevotella tannerae]|nr:biotin--[acetyl-CoA-carboxylase] ligase [Alloprevotella tannerae]